MKAFIAILAVLAISTVGFALYREWVVVQPNTDEGLSTKTTDVNIHLNKEKAKHDLKAAQNKVTQEAADLKEKAREGAETIKEKVTEGAQAVKEKAKEVADLTTVEGNVSAVNAAQNQLTVKSGDKILIVKVAKNAEILRGKEKIELSSIQVGDKVTLKVKDDGTSKEAQSVMVAPRK